MLIEDSLLQLRNVYASCIKLAGETDSKSETIHLLEEAKQVLGELIALCKHDYVVCLQSEYRGSYLEDFSDSHPEHRKCLCCGVSESARDKKFKIITTTPFARFEGKYPDQIKEPLKYLFTEAKEIAEKEGYQYFSL